MLKEHLSQNGFLWGPDQNPYGVSGFMVYAPLGTMLKHNLEARFCEVFLKEGFDPIETPVLYPLEAFEASGHWPRHREEMFATQTSDGRALVGRPEMATTIYPMVKQLLRFYHNRLPIRVSQMGIALPNDLQTDWQIRTRQYTAHEGHIIIEAGSQNPDNVIEYLGNLSYTLMAAAGIAESALELREKEETEKPFYATKAFGLYTEFEGEPLELLGIQYRSSYDFIRHSEKTHTPLTVNGVPPEAFEISFSTDRPFITLLSRALTRIENRVVLRIPEHLAPIPAQILPLKNDEQIALRAQELADTFRLFKVIVPIIPGSDIGRRYARADATGVPYVMTVDDESVANHTCTIRHRDAPREQTRIEYQGIAEFLEQVRYGITLPEVFQQLYEAGINRSSRL